MNLIKIGNLIINASMLIDAEFTEARSGVDEETGKEFAITAKLCLRFSAPQSEPHADYDGNYTGFAITDPYSRTLRGEEAETVWNELCSRDTRQPKKEDQ
jgi:hypothetical protein